MGQNEDAFTVNIFAPTGTYTSLPVLFWVYGGNLNSGSSNFPIYDPSEFVRQQAQAGSPCIVVTGNYRVGILGWLSTEDLQKVNDHPGNYGLYDVISMLEWIQNNISAFGGDPKNVTAFGESAGAYLLATLLHSGRYLFKKLILESGSHALMALRPKATFPQYNTLLESLKINGDSLTYKERVDKLKSVPADLLINKAAKLFTPGIWSMTSDPAEPGWTNSVWSQLEKGKCTTDM